MSNDVLPQSPPVARGLPLTGKVTLVVLGTIVVSWLATTWHQQQLATQLTSSVLQSQLAHDAITDRWHLDRFIEEHTQLSRLFASRATPANPDVTTGDGREATPPAWLASETIPMPRFTLLLGPLGEIWQSYSSDGSPVPTELLRSAALLQGPDQESARLMLLGEQPFVVASHACASPAEHAECSILVASPLDGHSLQQALPAGATQRATVLFTPANGGTIVASSDPQLLSGQRLATLPEYYLVSPHSFFDMDASASDLQFASLLDSRDVVAQLEASAPRPLYHPFALFTLLTLPLLALTLWLVQRIRRTSTAVAALATDTFGQQPHSSRRGDELNRLLDQVHALANALDGAEQALHEELARCTRPDNGNTTTRSNIETLTILNTVTTTLGVGVILVSRNGPVAANALMEQFVKEVGSIRAFMVGNEPGDTVRRLSDRENNWRYFRITHPELEQRQAILVQDVTEQKTLELERQQFLRLPSQSPNPVLRINSDGLIEYANEASTMLLEKMGCQVGERLPALLIQNIKELLASNTTTPIEYPLHDRIYAFNVTLLEGGDFLYLFATDITERVHTELALKDSEERFRGLLEGAPDAIIIIDAEGSISYANHSAETMFGYAPNSLQGSPMGELIPEMPSLRYALQFNGENSGHESATRAVPHQALHQDGHQFPVEVNLRPLESKDGPLLISIIRDVTEREEAEQEIMRLNLRLAEHIAKLTSVNKELEAFSYSVSHDLRGPLRSIDGFTHILEEDYAEALDEEGLNFLHKVRAASQRMGNLIDALLRLSRISRAQVNRVPINLSSIAEELVEQLRNNEPERQVEVQISPDMEVEADPNLMRALLDNLLGNAWKFTAQTEPARISFSSRYDNGDTIYQVQDNGAGFNMKYAEKLFAPFERLHSPSEFSGTGIGLATVMRIIQRHGGRIWAKGEPGQGATFYFTL